MSKALRIETKLMRKITTMAERETELFSVFNLALIKIVKHYTVYLEVTDRDVLHLKWRLVNYMKPSGLFGVLGSKTFWKPWCKQHSHSHQNIKKVHGWHTVVELLRLCSGLIELVGSTVPEHAQTDDPQSCQIVEIHSESSGSICGGETFGAECI